MEALGKRYANELDTYLLHQTISLNKEENMSWMEAHILRKSCTKNCTMSRNLMKNKSPFRTMLILCLHPVENQMVVRKREWKESMNKHGKQMRSTKANHFTNYVVYNFCQKYLT